MSGGVKRSASDKFDTRSKSIKLEKNSFNNKNFVKGERNTKAGKPSKPRLHCSSSKILKYIIFQILEKTRPLANSIKINRVVSLVKNLLNLKELAENLAKIGMWMLRMETVRHRSKLVKSQIGINLNRLKKI